MQCATYGSSSGMLGVFPLGKHELQNFNNETDDK